MSAAQQQDVQVSPSAPSPFFPSDSSGCCITALHRSKAVWAYSLVGLGKSATEKAFQRQQGASQLSLAQSSRRKGKARYWREVGLGFATPRAAKEGNYVDKKCPFTGNVSIRGRIIKGMVISTKMKRCVVIRRTYLHFVSKYARVEKRHKNVTCHLSPCFDQVKEGDIVTAGQCSLQDGGASAAGVGCEKTLRPLSKNIRFNVLKVEPNQVFGNVRKQFRLF
ncbi:hypothetical protein Efla_004919 [Eimeria flavescens]